MKLLIAFTLLIFACVNSIAANKNKTAGYNVENIKPGSISEKLGLQVGDVIISYDNKVVNSPSDAMDLYSKLKEGTVKTVVIERNGEKQTLSY